MPDGVTVEVDRVAHGGRARAGRQVGTDRAPEVGRNADGTCRPPAGAPKITKHTITISVPTVPNSACSAAAAHATASITNANSAQSTKKRSSGIRADHGPATRSVTNEPITATPARIAGRRRPCVAGPGTVVAIVAER